MTFQILGLIAIAALLAATLVLIARRILTVRFGAFWVLIWTAGGIALANPDITVVIAQALGIRRGADLLLYCSVLAMPAGFLIVYLRFRRMDAQLTKLVRELAILRAESQPGDEPPKPVS
jgi:hypothetical protein